MCKQKFKLSLLLFIFFLFFLLFQWTSSASSSSFLLFDRCRPLGLEEYWKHRSFGVARPLFLGSLIFLGICLLLPVFSFCIVLPALSFFMVLPIFYYSLSTGSSLYSRKSPAVSRFWGWGHFSFFAGCVLVCFVFLSAVPSYGMFVGYF